MRNGGLCRGGEFIGVRLHFSAGDLKTDFHLKTVQINEGTGLCRVIV